MQRSLLFNILALCVFAAGVFLFFQYGKPATELASTPQVQVSAIAATAPTSTPATAIIKHTATSSPSTKPPKPTKKAPIATSSPADEAVRIQNPYSTPPESFDAVNVQARAALVNILCQPHGGSLEPISGSGVIIDPRGVILTNAHVAQYVLLSESPQVNLSCTIRMGSPAEAAWSAQVLYIPPVWVAAHAGEILNLHPTGTGEHDYALLYITGSVTSAPLPQQFPFLPTDTRQAIGFPGDQILAASYPAEFIGGIDAEYALYAASSITTIKQLLTFETGSADVLSLGGIIEAQSGSSGGAVVNAWGRLLGIIATTSEGTTTAARDLRAVSLSYINTDLATQSGFTLAEELKGSPSIETQEFTAQTAPQLIQEYLSPLSNQPQQ